MEGTSVAQSNSAQIEAAQLYQFDAKASSDALILSSTVLGDDDTVEFSFDAAKGVTLTAQEIVGKLNELLKKQLPNGIESLKPEEVTPEATATRIVQGTTALFDAFAEQNPELEGDELVDAFIAEVKKGVEAGYEDAFETLEALGAFSFDGVQSGIEETKRLIGEKLDSFAAYLREKLGVQSTVEAELEKQSGATLNAAA